MRKQDVELGDVVEYRQTFRYRIEGECSDTVDTYWIPGTVVSIDLHHDFKSIIGIQGADHVRRALPMDSPEWRVV